MTSTQMDATVREIREIQRMIEELTADLEAHKDSLKAEMINRGTEELTGGSWKATWHTITSSRLDTKALKASAPDVYAQYTRTTTTSRFTLT